MKKIIFLCLIIIAVQTLKIEAALAQTVTTDSFYKVSRYPQNLIELSDNRGNKCGFILVYTEGTKVSIFFIPEDGKSIKKGSKEEKKIVEIILKAYHDGISTNKMRVKEKIYRNKQLSCLVLNNS